MVRGKMEIRRTDHDVSRRTAFVERRAGLFEKARQLAVLCDVDVGVLVFADGGAGQPFDYCSPRTSWSELIQRYEDTTNAQLQGTDHHHDQKMLVEMAGLRPERDRLEASLRRQTGEDLPSGATWEELGNLDQQLELTLGKVREMKDKLVKHQLDESRRKVHILEDQNSFLRHMMNEQHRAAAEASVVATETEGMMTATLPFGGFFREVEEGLSTLLQLWPHFSDVQGFGLQPSLRLC